MKLIFTFLCTWLFFGENLPFGNTPEKIRQSAENSSPKTLLWKVSKSGMPQPSYLLGINHVVSAEWLNDFPEIRSVIDSADVLMTEFYGDNDKAIFGNNKQADSVNRAGVKIRAVDLLTARQYATLDSFFVARVGEGITNNQDALEMNVWELSSAILMTLLSDKSKQGVTLPCMDRELYTGFKNKQKKVTALDAIENLEFGSKDKERGKEILSRFVEASKTGDYPGWNLSDTSYTAGRFLYDYKKMNLDYQLDKEDPESVSLIGSHTSRERNISWMPQIESGISQNRCLIAVGALHLWYKTGLISLLRAKGYQVEPVFIAKVNQP
ncbi:TraB/GumN family protein [Dyadobacter sediminis]|uniref:TraB/GumN family protein n=1 Tax=Dyadobacter sediminis TaxID=1493691 RepID=A0A5R9KBF9_9BACT|nr:TraB/GumN family protein [Dyadobacter sediminis]TLU92160.1 TraB/GumN family protein [Dyadobacter sediminis]GGB96925.1 GumN family protein [Dyadobacter sediminis]